MTDFALAATAVIIGTLLLATFLLTPRVPMPPKLPPVWYALHISQTVSQRDTSELTEARAALANYSPGAYVYEIRMIDNELQRREREA